MKKLLMCMLALLTLNACTQHITDFTMISTRNVALNKTNLDNKPQSKNIIGEDKVFMLLFIPFGIPKIEPAVNDALHKGNGDLLVDASLETTGWWFIVGEMGYEIKGTVVNTRAGDVK